MKAYSFLPGLLIASCAWSASAQTEGPGWVSLEKETEIAFARSAAPSTVSADATIWLLDESAGTYSVGLEGGNGNHCLVMRSYPKSMEPLCYDAEGARTILPIELRRFELRTSGHSWEEIDATIDVDIEAGRLAIPERPAMSYMQSSAQELYSEEGQYAGNWKPHLMIYIPYATNEDFGLMAGPTSELVVVDPGKATANVIIVTPTFVDPDTE